VGIYGADLAVVAARRGLGSGELSRGGGSKPFSMGRRCKPRVVVQFDVAQVLPGQQTTIENLLDNYGSYRAVLDFLYQAFIGGFRVTDKQKHENHSHKIRQRGAGMGPCLGAFTPISRFWQIQPLPSEHAGARQGHASLASVMPPSSCRGTRSCFRDGAKSKLEPSG